MTFSKNSRTVSTVQTGSYTGVILVNLHNKGKKHLRMTFLDGGNSQNWICLNLCPTLGAESLGRSRQLRGDSVGGPKVQGEPAKIRSSPFLTSALHHKAEIFSMYLSTKLCAYNLTHITSRNKKANNNLVYILRYIL